MLTTMAFVAALSVAPAQNGELKLSNVRPTYGVLGAVRKSDEILPGDVYSITFDIDNLVADAEGKVEYNMGLELRNPKGRVQFKRDPAAHPLVIYNVLGGNRIPAFAHAETGAKTEPGDYTLIVTVVDRGRKGKADTQTLTRKFTVKKPDFGMVRVSTSYDEKGAFPAPNVGVAGQLVYINFWVVGFERKNGNPNLEFEMYITDKSGQRTVKESVKGNAPAGVPAQVDLIPMIFPLPLNRVGEFTVVLKAKDAVSNKTADVNFPITVLEQK